MDTPRRIAAIILTFRPDLELLRCAVISVCPQVDQLLIVDNGAPWDASVLLDALPNADRERLTFMWLEKNIGVGAGHNRGIQWARERGFSHVLLLDHDSIPRPDMVRHLVSALDQLCALGISAAIVASRFVDRDTGRIHPFVRMGPLSPIHMNCSCRGQGELLEMDFLISSGALIPIPVLDDAGNMNEELFIDHVDTEWILRCKARGYRLFGVCDAIMEHSVGYATLRFWFGRWRHMPLHDAQRDYYLFRNSIHLYRMPHVPWRWIGYDLLRLVGLAVIFPVCAPDGWRRICLIARGVWHGLRHVTGPIQ